ncbi:VWA domain-containing protein [Methanospirillum sp. J.3.6.1-F.2.7.3]|uniref:VWA domain-containing protein n=1 Tax=Methanospirillum purgamenti TaxID=2834276 RepID=A0A8E7AZG7_9EURY|nr:MULTISPECIES: VWA domain-containing protein [Methanospirillum]MDX8550291.1 VWA domain-containing protein [Methanospirillum hungatei]QVV88044.1 VWA domain-containing protein [Methanospirillum sp. J.3.6.1-F.2.7.3]
MKIRFISILFLCTCILIGTLTVGVFAGPTSGDIPSPGTDEQSTVSYLNNGNSISIPGMSVVDITGINAVNYPTVITYVTVNTPAGRAGELTKDDFHVFENGDPMEITSLSFPDKATRTKLDLAILFDDTGSMSDEIADMKEKVKGLTDSIDVANIDCRYALISFNDAVSLKQGWTSNPSIIKSAIDSLVADGGDDAPEADLDAIEAALALGFRPDAQHMILDITDEKTHYRDDGTPFSQFTIPETASHLLSNGTSYILVGPASTSGLFNVHNDKKELVKALGGSGLFIDIHSDEFSSILDKIQSIITQTYTIGYYTPHVYGEDRKIALEVQVGNDSDSGLYTATRQQQTFTPETGSDRIIPSIEQDAEDYSSTDDSMSILGSKVVDITGINGVNFPYVITYVTVNTTKGRSGGLGKDDFQVFEDGKQMNITEFSFTGDSSQSKLDLAIVFDDTGSMRDEINDLKEKVLELTDRIATANIDCRYALITFKDSVTVKQDWTSDAAAIKEAIDGLNASEGFDAPEANLDAIEAALGLRFRSDAQHMILDITDDMTHYRNDGTPFSKYTIPETAGNLLNNGTSFILVGPTMVSGSFNQDNDKRELVKALGGSGLFIDVHGNEFIKILDSIQGIITQTYTIGYYTTDPNPDGVKRTVEIHVGSDSDSGQYIAAASE